MDGDRVYELHVGGARIRRGLRTFEAAIKATRFLDRDAQWEILSRPIGDETAPPETEGSGTGPSD